MKFFILVTKSIFSEIKWSKIAEVISSIEGLYDILFPRVTIVVMIRGLSAYFFSYASYKRLNLLSNKVNEFITKSNLE